MRQQHFDRLHGTSTRRKHWVQQQAVSFLNVLWQLGVKQLGFGRLFVALNEDFPDSNTSATISQSGFHRFSCAHDGNTADLALKLDAIVGQVERSSDGHGLDGEMVETLFDKKTDDAIRGAADRSETNESGRCACGVRPLHQTHKTKSPLQYRTKQIWSAHISHLEL